MEQQFRRLDSDNRILGICVKWVVDKHANLSWLTDANRYEGVSEEEQRKYIVEDDARLDGYHRGDWYMKGCWAEADICVNGVIQTIKSGGLWGIESDCGDEYAKEIEEEETAALKEILAALGFKTEETNA